MTQKTTGSTPRLLPFDEADAVLNGALLRHLGRYETVLLFDGDLTVDSDFLTAIRAITDAEPDVVAISGNLTVHGEIALYEPTPCLYVGGFTRAETLESGDREVYIHDGAFTYLVYWFYNDASLRAASIEVPWVLSEVPGLSVIAPNAFFIDNYSFDNKDADFDRTNIAKAFVLEIIDQEYDSVKVDLFLERLRAGQPVLRPDFQSSRPPRKTVTTQTKFP
jgi:hypothetical protein